MREINKYYSLTINEKKEANINIYGDITSWEWFDSDVSSYTLSKELDSIPEDIETINVYINSYGGEVAEGLAIYNSLKRHKAKVKTYCDGFACSIASVIFMAGEERIMSSASLLMIHNAWTYVSGNANELRKEAEDLETITQASINAYMSHINITEDELKEMLDNETWITPADAVEKGFATKITEDDTSTNASQSIRNKVVERLTKKETTQVNIDENVVEKAIKKAISKMVETPKENKSQEPKNPTEPKNTLKDFLTGKSQRKDD